MRAVSVGTQLGAGDDGFRQWVEAAFAEIERASNDLDPVLQDQIDALQEDIDAKETLGQVAAINTQTDSYTLVLADKGYTVEMNKGSANALTVPPNASVVFPVKSVIWIVQVGAGQTTITAGSGVTVRSRIGLKLAGQWAVARIYKRGTNEWVASGDLTT